MAKYTGDTVGYQRGAAVGYTDGYEAGMAKGLEMGEGNLAKGKDIGFEQGLAVGLRRGEQRARAEMEEEKEDREAGVQEKRDKLARGTKSIWQ